MPTSCIANYGHKIKVKANVVVPVLVDVIQLKCLFKILVLREASLQRNASAVFGPFVIIQINRFIVRTIVPVFCDFIVFG